MDKFISILSVITFMILVLFGIFIVYQGQNTIGKNTSFNNDSTLDNNESYIPFYNHTQSKIVLLNSNISYAKSEKTQKTIFGEVFINKGDPYVIINATIRNDYDKDYYFLLYCILLNDSGEAIAKVKPAPEAYDFSSPYVSAKKHENTFVTCKIIYNKTDVTSTYFYIPGRMDEAWMP